MSSSTNNRTKAIIVGSINADVFIEIDRLPSPGETLSANRPDTGIVMPGGKGANQAVAVSKLLESNTKFTTHFCGRFGNDNHVEMLKKVLKENNVDYSLTTSADVPSGQAYILLQKGGQNSIILVGAANSTWPSSLPDSLTDSLSSAAVVMLQREIPDAVNLAVAKEANRHSVPVFLDMGGEDSPISSELLSFITFLTANETELARISGQSTESDDEVKKAAEAVQKKFGVKNILITLGERGSILFLENGSIESQQATKVEADKIVDTTGAGDCFRAAFAVGYLEGRSWPDCLKFASAASAICVQTKGAMPSMPKREEVEKSKF